VTIVLMLQK